MGPGTATRTTRPAAGTGYEKLLIDDAALHTAGRRLLAKSLAELGDPPEGW